MTAPEFLRGQRDAVVESSRRALVARHYADAAKTRERLEALYTEIVESVDRHDVTNLLAHTRRLAHERFDAGFDLSEVQSAFNALEETLWTRIFAEVPAPEIAETLGPVTTAFGAAKDALAREWVAMATGTHSPSLDLTALFAGTERAIAAGSQRAGDAVD